MYMKGDECEGRGGVEKLKAKEGKKKKRAHKERERESGDARSSSRASREELKSFGVKR